MHYRRVSSINQPLVRTDRVRADDPHTPLQNPASSIHIQERVIAIVRLPKARRPPRAQQHGGPLAHPALVLLEVRPGNGLVCGLGADVNDDRGGSGQQREVELVDAARVVVEVVWRVDVRARVRAERERVHVRERALRELEGVLGAVLWVPWACGDAVGDERVGEVDDSALGRVFEGGGVAHAGVKVCKACVQRAR